MSRIFLRKGVFLSFLRVSLIVLLSGCSTFSDLSSPLGARDVELLQAEGSPVLKSDRLEVEILDEVFDGEMLALVLEFTAFLDITPTTTDLTLTFFGDGALVGSEHYTLSELRRLDSLKPFGSMPLRAGQSERLLLQQDVPLGVSDYQVEVTWAEGSATRSEGEDELRVDESPREIVRDVQVAERPMECSTQCFVSFVAALKLSNPFAKPITNVRLVAWFQADDGEPLGEEPGVRRKSEIPVLSQVLAPHKEFQLQILLKPPLPYDLYEKGYRPVVELSSFEFAPERR
jgi:hypothetical protein